MSSILIVDDSPTMVHLISDMLKTGSHKVITSSDGMQALQVAAEQKPDLILLDIILPKLTGYQVCRMLKAAPETKQIPVVMLTSKTKDRDRDWGLRQGADDYVTKPFKAEDLLAVIRKVLTATDQKVIQKAQK